jgi:ATP-dependent protease ClpP protease subunit
MSSKEQKPANNEVISECKELAQVRNTPLLVLNLETVVPHAVIAAARELKGKNFKELDVVLNTPGGHIESAFNLVKLMRKHAKSVNIFVPHISKSAGTLMCLCADRIIMDTTSELGPLDTQIREMQEGDSETYKSALNGFKALEQVRQHALENLDIAAKLIFSRSGLKMGEATKLAIDFSGQTSGCLYNQLNPITIGEYARALEVGQRYGIVILSRYMGWTTENATSVIRTLVYEYPSHGYCIDVEELQSLGLPGEEIGADLKPIIDSIRYEMIHKMYGKGGSDIKLIEIEKKSDKIETNDKKKTKHSK